MHFIKHYPIASALFAVIIVVSLVPVFPETPLDNVRFIDKWTHTAMYAAACMAAWWEYWRRHLHPDYEKLGFWAWLMPIVLSGALELLQEYCTGGHRNGDWLDLAANAAGATLAAMAGLLLIRCWPRA